MADPLSSTKTLRCRLTLIRHGTTEANTKGLFLGQTDTALSPDGEREVAALGARLATAPIDALVTSDLIRARATAEALVKGRPDLSALLDPRLREMHLGDFEGMPAEEVRRRHPGLMRQWAHDPTNVRMLGGSAESLREVQARAYEAIGDLLARHPEGHLVAVSHTFTLLSLVCRLLEIPLRQFRRFHVDRASVSEIRWGRFGPTLHSFNDTGHLLRP